MDKKPYKYIEFELINGKIIKCDINDWQEEVKHDRSGYVNHFHLVNQKIIIPGGDLKTEEITHLIPQHAILKIKLW